VLFFIFRTLLGRFTFVSSAMVAKLCQSSATFCKTRVRLRSESLCVCILLQYISVQEQKIEPANISLLRVPRNVSYEQWNKVYSSLQYEITEWLVDIQNMGTLAGEKLKKKFCSLKLTHLPDEFVIFDTHPQDLIVVSDDLTTANMDRWTHNVLVSIDKAPHFIISLFTDLKSCITVLKPVVSRTVIQTWLTTRQLLLQY